MVVCIINAIIFYFSRTRLGHCEINVIDFINTVLTDIFCILHILINVPLIVRIIALITLCIKKQFFFFFWKNLLQMHAYRRSNVFPSKIIFNYFIRFFPNVTIILSYNILLAPNILQEFSRDPSHFSRPWTIFLHSRNPPFFCSDIQPLFFSVLLPEISIVMVEFITVLRLYIIVSSRCTWIDARFFPFVPVVRVICTLNILVVGPVLFLK